MFYPFIKSQNQQEAFIQGITKSEKALTKGFERVVTLDKGSKPVPILYLTHLQERIKCLLSVRHL